MQLADHIADVFRAFGPVQLKRMFSGYGIFHDGIMFGLLLDEALYLKADAGNVGEFRALGLERFTYARKSRVVGLSYYRAPDSIMDDSIEAAEWARRSFDAALRAAKKRTASKKPGR